MIMTMARAISWGVSRMLGVPEEQPVAPGEVEHAHWDRVERRWVVHETDPAAEVAPAA
jgi:hypothetical protein